jgi:peptidoglycan/xylan/chitin deacetylase (PgdA/CDA1 family)
VKGLGLALLLACCARGKPEVAILNYHSVGDVADDYTVARPQFAEQLDWLVSRGYRTVSLLELRLAREGGPPLPRPAVVLTFDDGKEDALQVVLPELRKRGMHAAFFAVTGLIGEPGYLTWDGLRQMAAAGMEIGSHTVGHPRLADLPEERMREELVRSRQELEARLHLPVEAVAYPYNSVRSWIANAAAEAGYRVGVAGAAQGGAELLQLYRFTVSGRTSIGDFQAAVQQR